MEEYLLNFAKNIMYYSLLVVIVMQLLPETANKKYVKLYCGLVFLLVFFVPILDLTGKKAELQQKNVFYTYQQEVEEMLNAAQLYQNTEKKKILQNYGAAIAEDMESFLYKKGMIAQIQVIYDEEENAQSYGKIKKIIVQNKNRQGIALEKIRGELAQKYGIEQKKIEMVSR